MNLSSTFAFIAFILIVMGLSSYDLSIPLISFTLSMGGFIFGLLTIMILIKESGG